MPPTMFRSALPRAVSKASIFGSMPKTASFSTSRRLLNSGSTALPVQKPLGAFRGGLFGFLFGSTVAGGSVYYYILDEYRLSNEMLTEDIYALQTATQRLGGYIVELEEKVDQLKKK